MKKKKGFLVIALAAILLLSFGSMALAGAETNELQELQEKNRQELQKNEQKNESKQLRIQECEDPCSVECEPEQKRLQENKNLNESKEIKRQLKQEERKAIN